MSEDKDNNGSEVLENTDGKTSHVESESDLELDDYLDDEVEDYEENNIHKKLSGSVNISGSANVQDMVYGKKKCAQQLLWSHRKRPNIPGNSQ